VSKLVNSNTCPRPTTRFCSKAHALHAEPTNPPIVPTDPGTDLTRPASPPGSLPLTLTCTDR
jgi:hypothetical protein